MDSGLFNIFLVGGVLIGTLTHTIWTTYRQGPAK
jgi:hypothetical protein